MLVVEFGRKNVESSVVEVSVLDERCFPTEQLDGVSLDEYCLQDDVRSCDKTWRSDGWRMSI